MEINAHTFFCDFCEWWNEAVCSIHVNYISSHQTRPSAHEDHDC